VEHGLRVLNAQGEPRGADSATLSALAVISDAAATMWRARRDAEALDLARRLIRRALVVQPNAVGLLRRSAALASEAGDYIEATRQWAVVRAGAELGSAAWFEATTGWLESLAFADPREAERAIDAHFALYPDGGPAPWGQRIAAIRDALRKRATP
ncbi:MAG: hypothetical protein ACTS27_11015, partial [Phycisphaerales bacterium]